MIDFWWWSGSARGFRFFIFFATEEWIGHFPTFVSISLFSYNQQPISTKLGEMNDADKCRPIHNFGRTYGSKLMRKSEFESGSFSFQIFASAEVCTIYYRQNIFSFEWISPGDTETYIVCFYVITCLIVLFLWLLCLNYFITLLQHVRGQSALCCQIDVCMYVISKIQNVWYDRFSKRRRL